MHSGVVRSGFIITLIQKTVKR